MMTHQSKSQQLACYEVGSRDGGEAVGAASMSWRCKKYVG